MFRNMTPEQMVFVLRRIAQMIDSSERPSRSAVANDLNTVLSAVVYEYDPSPNESHMGEVITVDEDEESVEPAPLPAPLPAPQILPVRRDRREPAPPWDVPL